MQSAANSFVWPQPFTITVSLLECVSLLFTSTAVEVFKGNKHAYSPMLSFFFGTTSQDEQGRKKQRKKRPKKKKTADVTAIIRASNSNDNGDDNSDDDDDEDTATVHVVSICPASQLTSADSDLGTNLGTTYHICGSVSCLSLPLLISPHSLVVFPG